MYSKNLLFWVLTNAEFIHLLQAAFCTAVLNKRMYNFLSMEKYRNPPTEWVTKDPKLVPTIQCHAGPYTPSNSCKNHNHPTKFHWPTNQTTETNFESPKLTSKFQHEQINKKNQLNNNNTYNDYCKIVPSWGRVQGSWMWTSPCYLWPF